ncbi:acetyltransferase, gnat family protein [Companilactobacillus mindensis DSM 14500]|uniref:Acetyltransferase, gnat family protein n=1 Tax=Companilactobacillus mindensis DSM 14500 TaxID=1423770 RepID=A0A0R1QDP9_9LACO|nr:GNAT family N-acetyltransferase [Companilactobacillus mindensis]KRL42713.1 acetyltransferase, gnat family protein [Companilactobacillus mindensis DSM 14500]GEO78507.1 acetyltransferase [Companilactobacillus mindensis]
MSDQLKLREAIPSDAKNLLAFLKKASQQTDFIVHADIKNVTEEAEESSLAEIYNSEFDELMVAILDEEVIGFARLENVDDQKAEFGVVVDKEFWNNGIASYLIEDILDWAKESPLTKVFLEVYKNNPAAIHIYQKYGFTTELEKETTLVMGKMV